MGSTLCEHCAAACCQYLALPIDKPTSGRDYDDMRWYLMHEGITIFVDEGDWYVQYATRCKSLGVDNLCQVYDNRPGICREYEAKDCDYSGGSHGYDHYFTHASQVEAFYERKTGKKLPYATSPAIRKTRKKVAKKKKSPLVQLTV